MQRSFWLIAAAVLLLSPMSAKADFMFGASLGVGGTVKPSSEWEPMSLVLTPGYTLLGDILRIELGLVTDLPAAKAHQFDFGIRPMIVLDPPVLPFYARAIFAVTSLLNSPVQFAYGGAIGVGFDLLGLGAFAEAGLLPRTTSGGGYDWLIEGRVGAYYVF